MKRTQIYLPEELLQELRLERQKLKTSMSEVIRQAVAEKMAKQNTAKSGMSTLARIAAIGAKGPRDLAQNLEYYLYGKRKK